MINKLGDLAVGLLDTLMYLAVGLLALVVFLLGLAVCTGVGLIFTLMLISVGSWWAWTLAAVVGAITIAIGAQYLFYVVSWALSEPPGDYGGA